MIQKYLRKIIFLDIDGVLNHENFYKNYDYIKRSKLRDKLNDEWGEPFCPNSTYWINKLIKETNAEIVISSSKRHIEGNLDYMNKMWKNRGFEGKIIGITPFLSFKQDLCNRSVSRGEEILEWFDRFTTFRHSFWSKEEQDKIIQFSGISNYLIIDDDSDMLYNQRNHFIHVFPSPSHKSGFNSLYYRKALKVLKKTVTELNF